MKILGGRLGRRAHALVPNINLYPEDPFYDSIFGKILKWSVSVGRHIVIVTELVVIGSFLSRFVLDRQLSDLNREIVQKQAVAESYGSLDEDFRALQRKSSDITSILEEQGQYEVLESLNRLTPPEIRFEQVGYGNNTLSVQGISLSNQALSQFVDGLRRDPMFLTVSIGNIRSGDARDPAIQFTVSAQTNIGGTPAAPASPRSGSPATSDADEDLL